MNNNNILTASFFFYCHFTSLDIPFTFQHPTLFFVLFVLFFFSRDVGL